MGAPAQQQTCPNNRRARATRLLTLGCGVCSILASLVVSLSVASAQEQVSFHLQYAAPQGCPSKKQLEDQILARTSRAAPASESNAQRSFVVTLQSVSEGQVTGRLVLRSTTGPEDLREVPAASCEEAVAAIALIAALAIDPLASTRPLPSPSASASAISSSSAPKPEPLVPSPAPTPLATPAPLPPVRAKPWQLGIALGPAISSGQAPSLSFALGIGLELRAPWSYSPSARLDFIALLPTTSSTAQGDATFSANLARLSLMPLRFPSQSKWSVGPWLWGEAGELVATGSRIEPARSARLWWGALGGGARFEWWPLSRWVVGVGGGLVAPLIRDSFYFRPEEQIHKVPAVGWAATLDLGAQVL